MIVESVKQQGPGWLYTVYFILICVAMQPSSTSNLYGYSIILSYHFYIMKQNFLTIINEYKTLPIHQFVGKQWAIRGNDIFMKRKIIFWEYHNVVNLEHRILYQLIISQVNLALWKCWRWWKRYRFFFNFSFCFFKPLLFFLNNKLIKSLCFFISQNQFFHIQY